MNKEELMNKFIDIYTTYIKREGSDTLLDYLKKSDFFIAPASSKYHNNCEGGLVDHSINVYESLKNLNDKLELGFNDESIAIVGLLHDVCKIDFYKIEYRNRKNEETGKWEKYPFYSVDEKFPFGHSEKSCYIIQSMMKLTREECLAIRGHMGAWDKDPTLTSNIFEISKLALYTHFADLIASKTIETTY